MALGHYLSQPAHPSLLPPPVLLSHAVDVLPLYGPFSRSQPSLPPSPSHRTIRATLYWSAMTLHGSASSQDSRKQVTYYLEKKINDKAVMAPLLRARDAI